MQQEARHNAPGPNYCPQCGESLQSFLRPQAVVVAPQAAPQVFESPAIIASAPELQAVPEMNKSEVVASALEPQAIPEANKSEVVASAPELQAIPEVNKSEVVASAPEPQAIPEMNKSEVVVSTPEPQAVPEENKRGTVASVPESQAPQRSVGMRKKITSQKAAPQAGTSQSNRPRVMHRKPADVQATAPNLVEKQTPAEPSAKEQAPTATPQQKKGRIKEPKRSVVVADPLAEPLEKPKASKRTPRKRPCAQARQQRASSQTAQNE